MEKKEFYSREEVNSILNDYLIKTSYDLSVNKKNNVEVNNKVKEKVYV